MTTPIVDFVGKYNEKATIRLHMPGHKGKIFSGCEPFDITEVEGADELFDPHGIIKESEQNAASLFSTALTAYSAEGSSLCIRAMVYLALKNAKKSSARPYILAARNAHKAFVYSLALCDADVSWLCPESARTLCSCTITAEDVEKALSLADPLPAAVYLTSPDYLGELQPIKEIAEACHRYNVPLMVDNAHGAYLHFLDEKIHPIDLGADICCDSAHKTLPVLTGGAYLHVSANAPTLMKDENEVKSAMALFASTSPSYLILASLDRCNACLTGDYADKLRNAATLVDTAKKRLTQNGWTVKTPSEPLKITVCAPNGMTGCDLAERLRENNIECEYADPDYLVLMVSTETTADELDRTVDALGKNGSGKKEIEPLSLPLPERVMTVREAIFSPNEFVPAEKSLGRICAVPTVSCPPAIPIAVSGELIDEATVKAFIRFGTKIVSVVK